MTAEMSGTHRPDDTGGSDVQGDVAPLGGQSGLAPDKAEQRTSGQDPTLREDDNAYAFGATTQNPQLGPGRTHLPLGPGNEAMEGGASPAPRGYTGGAMGRVVAGLSPNFGSAAEDIPPPGGKAIYTEAEAATTFGPKADEAPPTG
jgi:hypothetical protein